MSEESECTSDGSEASEQMPHCSEALKHKSIEFEASEGIILYSKAIEKIHNPANCIFKNSECYICSTIKEDVAGVKSKVRSDELYYDWFVRNIKKDQNSQKKRKLDDSDDGTKIVVKHFKPTDNFDFFRNITGSEFSVGSSSETSNDEQLTEQEKALQREKEKETTRSLLHILIYINLDTDFSM